jgi:predicted aminopeptidase
VLLVSESTRFFPKAGDFYLKSLLYVAMLVLLSFLSGCQNLGYYAQATKGQFALLNQRQSISKLIASEHTDAALREQLQRVQRIRAFAANELGLPSQKQYIDYVALNRPYPVWAVTATAALSLEPKTWCYPIVGCLAYRGFFSEKVAQKNANELSAQGLDVSVNGVPAYSTLGWFRDPVLSSFLMWPEADLAELIFHELTHQRLYVAGDTTFNESLAVAVAEEGVRRYSQQYAIDREQWQQDKATQQRFTALLMQYREKLSTMFVSQLSDAEKQQEKLILYKDLQAAYQQQEQAYSTGDKRRYNAYARWLETANNAALSTVATYQELVPAFQQLLVENNGNLTQFFAACQQLARRPKNERYQQLMAKPTPLLSEAPSSF